MNSEKSTPVLPVLGRVAWMMIGPFALMLLAASIVNIGMGWFTNVDIAFLAVLAGMMLGRWLEFRGGEPMTAAGEPATAGHLRRYMLGAAAIGMSVWIIANIIGNYWIER